MKILIATDGSDFSKTAITHACEYLCGTKDEIRIVSVYDDAPIAMEAYGLSLEYHEIAVDAFRKRAEISLEAGRDIVSAHPRVIDAIITTTTLVGAPAKEIVGEAERWGADVIVVGSHGAGFWERSLLGSVSTSVLNHAPCSVLVVRDGSGK